MFDNSSQTLQLNIHKTCSLVCLLVCSYLVTQVEAAPAASTPKPLSIRPRQEEPERLTWGWMTEAWTGSDAPFLKIKREVDALEKDRKLNAALLQKVAKAAQKVPQDARSQFRWGYVMLQAPYAGIDLGRQFNNYSNYGPVVLGLAKPRSPRSYEYARLRFLLTVLRYEYPQLKEVGLRLFARNEQDRPVKSQVIRYLTVSRQAQERERALRYAQELVRDYPDRAASYSTLGFVYQHSLFMYGDLDKGDKAITAYQKYLAMLPSTAKDRREVALLGLRVLKEEKARQQKYGFKPPVVTN